MMRLGRGRAGARVRGGAGFRLRGAGEGGGGGVFGLSDSDRGVPCWYGRFRIALTPALSRWRLVHLGLGDSTGRQREREGRRALRRGGGDGVVAVAHDGAVGEAGDSEEVCRAGLESGIGVGGGVGIEIRDGCPVHAVQRAFHAVEILRRSHHSRPARRSWRSCR